MRQAIRSFLVSAVAFLDDLTKKGKHPDITQYEVPLFNGIRYHDSAIKVKPDYYRFIINNEKSIKDIPEYKQGIESLSKQEVFKDHYKGRIKDNSGKTIEDPDIGPIIGSDFFIAPLISLLEDKQSLHLDESELDALCEQLEEYLYSGTKMYYFAPIFNFELEPERLELDGGITISKISSDLFTTIWRSYDFSLLPSHMIFQVRYVMGLFYTHPKGKPISVENPRDRFRHVISALRLFKKGVPGFNILYSKSTGFGYALTSTISGSDRMSFSGLGCTLTSAEAQSFAEFWKFYMSTMSANNKFIDIAVRRFNSALEGRTAEDKLIDCMIALEALYGSEIDELRYRLSLRASILLGSGIADTSFIREIISESYKLRSKIVHGKSVKPIRIIEREITLNELVSQLSEYVRKSILAFMSLSAHMGSQEKIIEAIEESIIDGETRNEIIAKSKLSFIDSP
jgi:hypothetical protein